MLNFALQKETKIEPLTVKETLPVEIEAARSCPNCTKTLTSSGKYHFWCESGHYDLHEVIPVNERANYCKYCHDPATNGVCEACQTQPYSTFAEASKNLAAAA